MAVIFCLNNARIAGWVWYCMVAFYFLVLLIFFSFLIAVSCLKNKKRSLIKTESVIYVLFLALFSFHIFFILVTQGWPAEQVERGSHRLGDEAHQIASHGITRVNQLQFLWSSREGSVCHLIILTRRANNQIRCYKNCAMLVSGFARVHIIKKIISFRYCMVVSRVSDPH